MKNFRNNFRRSRYKNYQERNNHKNETGIRMISDMANGSNIVRKNNGRNNHNASKLIEKYSNLAREALSTGDKILSENYFQHADHFMRILNERELQKKNSLATENSSNFHENISDTIKDKDKDKDKVEIKNN